MSWLLPITLVVLAELIADIFAKEYSLKGHWYFWAGALLFYVCATMFWLSSLKEGSGLGRGVVVFSVCSAAVALLIGVCFYKEEVNKIQIIGMILGVVALALIFWEK